MIDEKGLEAACRATARAEAHEKFHRLDDVVEYVERSWKRYRAEVRAIIEAYEAARSSDAEPNFSGDDVDFLNNEWWIAGYQAGQAASRPASLEAARSAEPVAWATPEHGRRGGHPMPVEPAAEFMGLKVLVNPQLPPDAAYIESRRADGSVDRVCVRSHPKEAPDV